MWSIHMETLFTQLFSNNMFTREEQKLSLPKVQKAFKWLLQMSKPETFPFPDGIVYVNHQTEPVPSCVILPQLEETALGLLDGLWLFGGENFTYNK